MPPAFDFYKPQPNAYNAQADAEAQRKVTQAQQGQQSAQYAYNQRKGPSTGSFALNQMRDNFAATNSGIPQANARYAEAQNAAQATARDPVKDAENNVMRYTAGFAQDIGNDQYLGAANDKLQGGMNTGPYSEAAIQHLIARQADQTAKAEGTNNAELANQMAARGIGPDDPGYQAALRQAQSQRQQSNIAFAGDTRFNAGQANYAGQQSAANALASNRRAQLGMMQSGLSQGAGYLSKTAEPGGRAPAAGGSPFPPPQQQRQSSFSFTPQDYQQEVTGGSAPAQMAQRPIRPSGISPTSSFDSTGYGNQESPDSFLGLGNEYVQSDYTDAPQGYVPPTPVPSTDNEYDPDLGPSAPKQRRLRGPGLAFTNTDYMGNY